MRGRAFSVRRGGIPQSPPPAVPAPFGKGAFGAGTDQPAPKSPLALRTACPPPHPPPEGAGLFGQGGGIPQSPPPAVTAPFGKGAFGAETDQPAPKSPPCPKNCLPAPLSAPCGGRGYAFSVRGVRNPPVTACGGASPLSQGGLWSGDGPPSAEKPPLP